MKRLTEAEAAKIDQEDNTPYMVVKPGSPGKSACRYSVTGYTSARVVAGKDPAVTILTAAEARTLRGW